MDETVASTIDGHHDQAPMTCLWCGATECECPGYHVYPQPDSVFPVQDGEYYLKPLERAAPVSALDRLRNQYIFKLNSGQLRARFWLMSGEGVDHQTALALVPGRLGENKALDNAVQCICYSESAPCRTVDNARTSQAYVTALQSLQNVLNDPVLSRRPETLAAANILYNHELYIKSSNASWTIHANGLIILLRFLGPEGIQNDLGRFILLGNLGTIFMMAATLRQPCFLAESEWTEYLHETVVEDTEDQTNIFPEDVKHIVIASVQIPGLLCRYQEAVSSLDPGCLKPLMRDVFALRTKLQDWRRRYEGALRSLETEVEEALAMPVRAAYRMAAAIFVIVLDHLIANLQNRCRVARSVTEDVPRETFATVNHWTMLASNAKIKWLALKRLDTTSARACAACPKSVMAWVLEMPYDDITEVRSIRLVLRDLHNCLDPRL